MYPVIQVYIRVHLTNIYIRVHLTNVLIGNGSQKRTIYCYIWGIIFTCSSYYRVRLLFCVCLRISRYRVRFIPHMLVNSRIHKHNIRQLNCNVVIEFTLTTICLIHTSRLLVLTNNPIKWLKNKRRHTLSNCTHLDKYHTSVTS